jgi:hypothetical protein
MAQFNKLHDLYRFPGFVPHPRVQGVFGDPRAVLITLQRRQKKRCAASAVRYATPTTTNDYDAPGISPVATSASTSFSISVGFGVLGVAA